MNLADIIDSARRSFEIAGRGILVMIERDDEPRYAMVSEIAARLEPHQDATMLLVAVSDAVERYDPATEGVVLLETEAGFEVFIVRQDGMEEVGGLEFGPAS